MIIDQRLFAVQMSVDNQTVIDQWGWPIPSILSVEENGTCLDFVYENTVVPSPSGFFTWEYDVDGHVVTITNASGSDPDTLTVDPAVGWEVISESPATALDWATTIITVCQGLYSQNMSINKILDFGSMLLG